MDLATVKAKVKAWEKNFRAEHAREPTKADIKRDESNIVELYTTYRKLSKALPKESKKDRRSSDGLESTTNNNHTTPSRPRFKPALDTSPTTPTPRRLFGGLDAGPSKRAAEPVTPGRDAKRSRPGYSGPVHDPNPFRTPQKTTMPVASPFSARIDAEAQFIHAGSPRRLREVLEANSLKKSRERDVTPRTKARKRLAGEMDDSPFRVRKRRGEGRKPAAEDKENELDQDDDNDDEIGETPIKGAAFGLLDDTTSKPRDLFPIFQKARGAPATAPKAAPRKSPSSPPPKPDTVSSPIAASAAESLVEPTPELEPSPESAEAPRSATPAGSRSRIVVLGEEDEWDPESDKRVVKITGTRRPTVRGHWSDENFADHPGSPQADDEDADDDEADDEDETEDEDLVQEQDGLAETRSLASLSLRSPAMRRGERLADLRVRALLDPTSAAATALRAMTKGQDVFVSGEGTAGDDEEDIDGMIDIGEGDDDWESDPEGWKAVVSEEEW